MYSYELIVPVDKAESLYTYILSDLNRYSNYIGEIRKVQTKCLVLVRTGHKDKLQTKGGNPEYKLNNREAPYLKNSSFGLLVSKLNSIAIIKLPLIDETNYSGNIDVKFDTGFDDFEKLRKELQRYELDIVESDRELEMLVISEKVDKKNSRK